MKEIIIKMDTPKEAESLVLLLLKNGFYVNTAVINYNIRTGVPTKFRRLDQYPLTLYGTLNGRQTRVLVSPLGAGHRCEASYSLMKILKAVPFNVDPKDIYTLRKFNPETSTLCLRYSRY